MTHRQFCAHQILTELCAYCTQHDCEDRLLLYNIIMRNSGTNPLHCSTDTVSCHDFQPGKEHNQ